MRAMMAGLWMVSALTGCATVPAPVPEAAPAATTESFAACEDRMTKKLDLECQGRPDCYGAGGAGLQYLIVDACGPRPSPDVLTADMKQALNDHCSFLSSLESFPQSGARAFSDYADDSPIIKLAEKECARIYAANEPTRNAESKAAKEKIVIRLGSPERDVYTYFGPPTDTNTSVGPWGVHKQLVYGRVYIYIENGYVTSWQK